MAGWKLALLAAAATLALAGAEDESGGEHALTAGLGVALRAYQQCEVADDVMGCLKLRALRSLDRAARSSRIPLFDGVSLVQVRAAAGRALADLPPAAEVEEAELPAEPEERRRRVGELLAERLSRFLGSHALQLDLPRHLDAAALLPLDEMVGEEGRKEGGLGGGGGGGGGMKKHGGMLLMGLMMKGMMMTLAYKGVALLAGKALMVAKIALVLSAVIGLSKLLGGGGGGGEKTTYEIVKHPQVSHAYAHSSSHEFVGGHGGGGGGGGGGIHYEVSGGGGGGGGGGGHGWGRSMDSPPYPHLLAYRAHGPGAAAAAAAAAEAEASSGPAPASADSDAGRAANAA